MSTLPATTSTSPAASPSQLTAADVANIERYVSKSRADNTRRQYRSAWRTWCVWCAEHGHGTVPADPAAVAAYLAHRAESGAAPATVRAARAAIAAAHRDAGHVDPTRDHAGIVRTLRGIERDGADRGRGQAAPITVDGLAAIMATATIPRRTGRGLESAAAALQRGAVDKAIAGLLFQGGLRRYRRRRRSPGRTCRGPATATGYWYGCAARRRTRTAPPPMCATSRTTPPRQCGRSARSHPPMMRRCSAA